VLQGVAACCSLLQCVAVCCSVSQRVPVCRSVLQRVAACCRVLHCVAVCTPLFRQCFIYRVAARGEGPQNYIFVFFQSVILRHL